MNFTEKKLCTFLLKTLSTVKINLKDNRIDNLKDNNKWGLAQKCAGQLEQQVLVSPNVVYLDRIE